MTISINKFQQDIVEGKDLNFLLNEAYAIAIKIKDKRMTEWCHYELSGYRDMDNIPKYRKIPVKLVADGQFRKNIPVEVPENYETLNYHFVNNPIPSLLKLTQEHGNKVVYFEFPTKANNKLHELYPEATDLTFKWVAGISQLTDIESEVRERIINWGMQLKGEKENRKEDTNDMNKVPQTINYNVVGNIQNSQIQQGSSNSKQKRSNIKDLIGNLFGSLFGHLFK